MKAFLQKYKNIKYLIILFIIYLIGFMLLENKYSSRTIITSTLIDQYIPFNEYFVIPYLLWFIFIALGFAYFIFVDSHGFKRTCYYMFTGMFISLFIYFLFPNGQNLRVTLSNDNIFQILVSFIYSIDSPTNVCPSIHVYNSVMMCVSLMKSKIFHQYHILEILTVILTIFICASTVFIKQHAFIDIIAALILALLVYCIGEKKDALTNQ